MPDNIALILYKMFCTSKVTQLVEELEGFNQDPTLNVAMNLSDLEVFFAVFKSLADVDQVAFWFLKHKHVGKPNPLENIQNISEHPMILSHDDLMRFVKGNIMEMTNIELEMLYNKLRLMNISVKDGLEIDIATFSSIFQLSRELPIFEWIFHILDGFRLKNLNVDESEQKETQDRRLTQESLKIMRSMIQRSYQLQAEEVNSIKEFYDREFKSRDAKYILKLLQKMFSSISNTTLRQKYLINSVITKVQTSSFEYICRLAQIICKSDDDEEEKIIFLFDIFSGFQPQMKKQAMKDFADIFKIPPTIFPMVVGQITKEEFLDLTEDIDIDFEIYEVCRPMIIGMLALQPIDQLEEKQAILAVLNNNPSIETYITENLNNEVEQFYLCELKFWEQWRANVGFGTEDNLGLKLDHKTVIENGHLIEPRHEYRLKDTLEFMSDYIILPKSVFWPLSKWYVCDKEIERHVITYRGANLSKLGSSQTGGLYRRDSLRSSFAQRFVMSGQKFHKKNGDVVDDDFLKRVDDQVFELEINPKVIYLAPVGQQGELQYQQLIANRRVDIAMMTKALKLSTLPFDELQLSRKTTFQQLMNIAAKKAKQNPKKGRLIVDGTFIFGPKLIQTFEDFGLVTGTLIHYEFLNESNEWPSDKRTTGQQTPGQKGKKVLMTHGLKNLGNTCYMNSALQILANISQIYEYYVVNHQYQTQINRQALMGFKGNLAFSFASLMNGMWQSSDPDRVVNPKPFKKCVGVCQDQYSGFEQQDSQEFLSFLIDSLHEEHNLRLKKPYIINPDSKDRQVVQLGLENWSNSLRRDWSLFYFLFYGQIRSSLTCKSCTTESTTFDVFSNVPLSLPEPTQVTVSVIVYRLQNKIKDIFTGKITKDQEGIYSGPQVDDSDSVNHQSIRSAQNTGYGRMYSTRDKLHQNDFTESYNYLMNDQPIRVHIKVDAEIEFKNIMLKVAQIRETNLDWKQVNSETILYTINKVTNTVKEILKPDQKLSSIEYLCTEIHCMEVLTRKGKDTIRQFYKNNTQFLDQKPESCYRVLLQPSSRDELLQQPNQILQKRTTVNQSADSSESQSVNNNITPRQQIDKFKYFYQVQRVNNRLMRTPQDIIVICYHRRFIKKDIKLLPSYQPQIIASPFILTLPTNPSGRRVYEEVWSIASNLVKQNSKLQKPLSRWWERKDWIKSIEKGTVYKPFVVKTVKMNGFNCSKCHWTMRCSGCVIEPTDPPHFIDDMCETVALAIDWHPQTLSENYNPQVSEVIEHASVNLEIDDAANYTSLDDCLAKFHKPEILENEMRCKKCADLTPHIKKLEIFKPPPVLIIQLKRFRQVGVQWKKIMTSVDFPIKNLDLSNFITDTKFLKDQGIETKYNLHGTINHFGSLSQGHYTTCLRNQFDKKWYRYDDHLREEVQDQNIQKESAYILFYIRQDVEWKSVDKIYPNIEETMFQGKPITQSNQRQGFITSVQNSNTVEVKFQDNTTTEIIKIDDLVPDQDLNEIDNSEWLVHLKKQNNENPMLSQKEKSGSSNFCCLLSKKKSRKIMDNNQAVTKQKDTSSQSSQSRNQELGPSENLSSTKNEKLAVNTVEKPIQNNDQQASQVKGTSFAQQGLNKSIIGVTSFTAKNNFALAKDDSGDKAESENASIDPNIAEYDTIPTKAVNLPGKALDVTGDEEIQSQTLLAYSQINQSNNQLLKYNQNVPLNISSSSGLSRENACGSQRSKQQTEENPFKSISKQEQKQRQFI